MFMRGSCPVNLGNIVPWVRLKASTSRTEDMFQSLKKAKNNKISNFQCSTQSLTWVFNGGASCGRANVFKSRIIGP